MTLSPASGGLLKILHPLACNASLWIPTLHLNVASLCVSLYLSLLPFYKDDSFIGLRFSSQWDLILCIIFQFHSQIRSHFKVLGWGWRGRTQSCILGL